MVSEVTATWQQLFEQGKNAYANNDLVNAEDLFKTAFEQARYNGAPEDALAEMSFNLGVCYHSKEDFFNAEKCYTQALFSAERAYGNDSADVSTILRHLGSVYKQTNRAQEAKDVLRRADAIDAMSSEQRDEFVPPILDPILSEIAADPSLDSAFPESASSKRTNRASASSPDDAPSTLLLPPYEENPTMSLPALDHLSFPNQELHPRSPQSDLSQFQSGRSNAYESRSSYDSGVSSPARLPLPTKPQYPGPAKPQYPEPTKPQYPEPAQRPASQQNRRPGQPFVQKPAPGSTNNKLPARKDYSGSARSHESYDERIASAAQRTPQGYVDVDELVHPREKMYGSFSAAFGWFIYGMSALLLVGLILAPLALLGSYIVGGLNLGALRSRGIKVSPDQFPEVNELIEKYCTLLRMEVPEVYVIQEHGLLNAFANRLHRKDRLVICSEVLELAYKHGERELAFVVVHELTHVKRGHVRWAWLHIPADMIPFLGSAYSRACEYTCDRVAMHLVPDGALYGLVALATGTKLYRRVNLQALYDQQDEEWGFWTWYHEIQSTHPNLINRIRAIGLADQLVSSPLNQHR